MTRQQAKENLNTQLNEIEALVTEFASDHHYDPVTETLLYRFGQLEEAIKILVEDKTIEGALYNTQNNVIGGIDFTDALEQLNNL